MQKLLKTKCGFSKLIFLVGCYCNCKFCHILRLLQKKKIDEETKDEDKQIIRRVLADCPYIWFAWTTY